MGFFDSNSDAINPSGSAGSQTQQGDPVSVDIVSGRNQSAVVNVSNTNNFVDAGALEVASNIAQDAADLSNDALALSAEASQTALAIGDDLGARAFSLADLSIERLIDSQSLTQDFALDAIGGDTDFLENTFDSSLDFASEVVDGNRSLSTGFVDAVQRLSVRESQNNDGRLEALTKNAFVAIGAVIAIAVGGFVLSRR